MAFLELLAMALMFGSGWALSSAATWVRVHRQDSALRMFWVDIGVLMDMGEEVPPEWVLMRLEEIIQKDFR